MRSLQAAVVVRADAGACRVVLGGEVVPAGYGGPFRPRADELRPGQLVALAPGRDGGALVAWRWFDAVVVEVRDDGVLLWEPAHGEVLAQPRSAEPPCVPGSRRWLSAGLPGADWWVAGGCGAEPPDVELAEVGRFYAEHGLWERLG